MNDGSDSAGDALQRLRSGIGGDVAVMSMGDGRVEVIATPRNPLDPAVLKGFLPLDRGKPHRMFGTWLEGSATWLIATVTDPGGGPEGVRQAGPERALRGRGVVLAVLGPDGAGKTTALAALGASYVRPIRFAKLRLRSIRGPGPVRWVWELGRIVRLGLATRIARRRGEIIAWDRHPLEDELPWPTRRVIGPEWRWLAPIIPDPDVVVVLDAPVEVLMSRRPEEDEVALRQLRGRYRSWAEGNPRAHLVDATAPPAEVVQRMAAAVWQAELATTRSDGTRSRKRPKR